MTAAPAAAQMVPHASEVAAYQGLHAAAYLGDVAGIEKLVSGKVDVHARDSHGRTPLHVAVFAKQRAAIRAGANPDRLDSDRYNGVTIAAVADDEETLHLLLTLGASPKLVTSRYDCTTLIAAAHLGHAGGVMRLIAAGAPLDHVNNLHWTAVIESIVLRDGGARHQATLKALINAGANLQLTDRQGNTPMQLARLRGYQDMVQMLENGGCQGSCRLK